MTKTYIDELKAAVKLIRKECKKHNMCSNCPLYKITCHLGMNYPGAWLYEKIGVEDDE